MLYPAPTSKIDPHLARGTLVEVHDATATAPAFIVLEFPNSSYRTHLRPTGALNSAVGRRLIGSIHVEARRVDKVDTGGKYLEPVYGRPRRVQGRVLDVNEKRGTIAVDAGVPVHLKLCAPNQSPSDFAAGDLVSCDVRDGATFTPAG